MYGDSALSFSVPTHSFVFHSCSIHCSRLRKYHYTPFNNPYNLFTQFSTGLLVLPGPKGPPTAAFRISKTALDRSIIDQMATTLMDDSSNLPPLPEYHLTPLPFLLPPIPDKLLTLLLPIAAYWSLSMFFHWIDTKDYFPQYRLHTPAEVSKRNRVSRWEVIRDVLIQQVVQTAVGWVLGMTEPDDFFGKEQYDVAVWARRIRILERSIPGLLATVGLDAKGLAKALGPSHPMLAGALQGGRYPSLENLNVASGIVKESTPGFAGWELMLASAIYWIVVPALQFGIAILVVDTWQYFLHRAMHMNKWLYSRLLRFSST